MRLGSFVSFKVYNRYLEQSRRDDLISLAYLLCFFMQGKVSWFDSSKIKEKEFFKKIKRLKRKHTPADLCAGHANRLKAFVEACFGIQFTEDPDYPKLKHLLVKALLERDLVPNEVFDWSSFNHRKTMM
jgi:hypothetical protein